MSTELGPEREATDTEVAMAYFVMRTSTRPTITSAEARAEFDRWLTRRVVRVHADMESVASSFNDGYATAWEHVRDAMNEYVQIRPKSNHELGWEGLRDYILQVAPDA